MRLWMLAPLLMLAAMTARAADVCPAARSQQFAADPATRIAAVACNEYMLWYRPFFDRNGRMANSGVTESETSMLDDGYSQAWRRVAGYWQESGLLQQMGGVAGAGECAYAGSTQYPSPACRAFIIDNAWSAVFVSWVMRRARLPGFRASASHIDYVRAAYQRPETNAYQYLDPTRAKPATGDLLCYVRGEYAFGYAGLLRVVGDAGGLNMHCDIVVAVNPGNDSTAYLIGGNVQQGVTMRLLPLNRNGEFWSLPQRVDGGMPCSPDNLDACNFNRQDWAVLLKLKSREVLAQLPGPPALPSGSIMPSQPRAPVCCVNCVVGSGVPRCPQPGTP